MESTTCLAANSCSNVVPAALPMWMYDRQQNGSVALASARAWGELGIFLCPSTNALDVLLLVAPRGRRWRSQRH